MDLSILIKYLEKQSHQLSFQKYKSEKIKHYNKMNKVFDTQVEDKSKGQLPPKGSKKRNKTFSKYARHRHGEQCKIKLSLDE